MQHINQFIDTILSKDMLQLIKLSNAWKKTVIEDIQNVTSLSSYNDGLLKVIVHDNIWNEELKYLKSEIIKQLNSNEDILKLTNNQGIKNIIFKYKPKKLLYLEKDKEPIPEYEITEHINNYIEKSCKVISEESIREKYKKMLETRFKHENFYEWIKE